MATITRMPASTASRIASAVKAGGTKIIVASAAGLLDRFADGVEHGQAFDRLPALPGVTPPTICVPYSRQPRV